MSEGEIKTVLSSKLTDGPHGIGTEFIYYIYCLSNKWNIILPKFIRCCVWFSIAKAVGIELKGHSINEFNARHSHNLIIDYLSFLGDPDDRTLRTSERKVLIPQLIRERARKIKCVTEVSAFEKCCKEHGLMMSFNCKPQTEKFKECMARWYYNEDFVKECTQIYLDERSEYRRTGVSKKKEQKLQALRDACKKT